MPSLGADMEDGTFVEWHVEPGQDVTRGQVICVVETQKGAIDVEIWEGGVLAKLTASPGQKIPVGQVMALVATGGEDWKSIAAASLDRKRRAGRRSRGPRRWSPHRAPYPDRRSG